MDSNRRGHANAATVDGVPLPTRPTLKPALRQLWRTPTTLQLGLDPSRAVMVAGLAPSDQSLLSLLDGSRDLGTVVTEAGAAGCDPERAVRVLELLAAADALDDGPPDDPRLEPDALTLSLLHTGAGAAARVLRHRASASVAVHGAGRVGATVAGLLAAAGVGTVGVVDNGSVRPADLSPAGIRDQSVSQRGLAAVRPLRRRGHWQTVATGVPPRVDVAVVAPTSSVAAPEVLTAVRRLPHVLVAVRETTASVGPFVLPGRSACVRCWQLARSERDPSWVSMTAQLVGTSRAVEACDVTLATLGASLAAMQVLAHLDGRQVSARDGVCEFDLAGGRLRRRSVPAHPACGCGAADAAVTMDE